MGARSACFAWLVLWLPLNSYAQEELTLQPGDSATSADANIADADAAQTLIGIVRVENDNGTQWSPQILQAAREVINQDPRYRWLPPPQISLDEARVVLGCQAWDPRCIAALGKTVGARHVLYVEVVRPFSYAALLTVLLVDVASPEHTWPIRVQLNDFEATGLLATEVFVRDALGPAKTCIVVSATAVEAGGMTAVSARSQCVGAKLFVDEHFECVAPCRLAQRPAPGTRTFRVEHSAVEGLSDIQFDVGTEAFTLAFAATSLTPGSASTAANPSQNLDASQSSPASSPDPVTHTNTWQGPAASLTLAGGGVALVAASVLYALHYSTASRLATAATARDAEGHVVDLSQGEFRDLANQDQVYQIAALSTALGAGALVVTGTGLLLWPWGTE